MARKDASRGQDAPAMISPAACRERARGSLGRADARLLAAGLLLLLPGCAPCRCEVVRALRVGDRLAIIYADSLIDGSTAGTVLVPSGRAGEWVRDSTRRDK